MHNWFVNIESIIFHWFKSHVLQKSLWLVANISPLCKTIKLYIGINCDSNFRHSYSQSTDCEAFGSYNITFCIIKTSCIVAFRLSTDILQITLMSPFAKWYTYSCSVSFSEYISAAFTFCSMHARPRPFVYPVTKPFLIWSRRWHNDCVLDMNDIDNF